jgi:hypothetical protein
VQIYVDDIFFYSTNAALVEEFTSLMNSEFEMSTMEDNFHLGAPNQATTQ